MVRRPGSKETDMSTAKKNKRYPAAQIRPTAVAMQKPSKKARLEAMLCRPRGATQKQLERTLGWQPQSVRAAISVLRKGGAQVTLDRSSKTPAYRIDTAA